MIYYQLNSGIRQELNNQHAAITSIEPLHDTPLNLTRFAVAGDQGLRFTVMVERPCIVGEHNVLEPLDEDQLMLLLGSRVHDMTFIREKRLFKGIARFAQSLTLDGGAVIESGGDM